MSRRVTGSGVLGHAVSEKGKGCRCLSFCSMGSLFKQEQGITIFYRLCTGVSWVKNQSGDEKVRQGRKDYHGGCGGGVYGFGRENYEKWSYFDLFGPLIETEAGHKYPLSIG